MFSSAQDRNARYAALKIRLGSLRTLFPNETKAEVYCALFDDFLANSEFGLALEVLCDFLLEPEAHPVGEIELSEIAKLHAEMELQDQCFLRLNNKRLHFESTNGRQ